MREDLPRGEVTLLLTGIEGGARLLQRLGAQRYATVLAEHRALLRDAMTRQGGVEVDNQGDSFLFAFPTAQACFGAAIEAQRTISRHAWPENVRVRTRMGMHSGTPEITEEGYVGEDLHEAARIAYAAHGEQVLLSERTAERLADSLDAGSYRLRDLGEHVLKDIEGLRRLFQAVAEDLRTDFPALTTEQTRPNNLPAPTTPFIGRTELITQIRDLLLRDQAAQIVLTGPAGAGKTRLAIRVANELSSHFSGGAFIASVGTVTDPHGLVGAVASALGLTNSTLDAVRERLAADPTLLLIDAVDPHAVEGLELITESAGAKVIATCDAPLRGNLYAIPVPPLTMPDRSASRAEEIAEFEAVKLFVDRAQAVRPDFELTDACAADVVAICHLVGGWPRNIELAASRIRTMQPARLARALERRPEAVLHRS